MEVVVVCNGCTDNTAEIARSFRPEITVIETTVGSKIVALNLGDEAATSFPRIYLDGDIELESGVFAETCATLRDGVLASSPRPLYELSKSSWLVRMYYAARMRLPFQNPTTIGGCGLYALTREGRARFDQFPNLISDDGFIRLLFAPNERRCTPNARTIVHCPHRMSDLLKITTRVVEGNRQLHQLRPDLFAHEERNRGDRIRCLLRNPLFFPCFVVYALTKFIATRRAQRTFDEHGNFAWHRDESHRS